MGPERVSSPPRWTEDSLRAATDRHRRNWWKTDQDVAAFVRADGNLLERAEAGALSTTDVYYRGADPYLRTPTLWTPERQARHERLVQAQVGRGDAPAQPLVYLTIGPMGVGKTSQAAAVGARAPSRPRADRPCVVEPHSSR